MARTKDLLIYLLSTYDERKRKISKTRLTKLVYLCDWKSAIEYGRQITRINWVFDNYGPFVWDVMNVVEDNPELFQVKEVSNSFGSDRLIISYCGEYEAVQLTEEERSVAKFVIQSTEDIKWSDFIKLVYSTYPVVASIRHTRLDLVQLANEYRHTPFFENVSPEIEYLDLHDDNDDF